jgi:hypothetical protein
MQSEAKVAQETAEEQQKTAEGEQSGDKQPQEPAKKGMKAMEKMAQLECPDGEVFLGHELAALLCKEHKGQIFQRWQNKIWKLDLKHAAGGGFKVDWLEEKKTMMQDQYGNYWFPQQQQAASSSASGVARRDRSRSR